MKLTHLTYRHPISGAGDMSFSLFQEVTEYAAPPKSAGHRITVEIREELMGEFESSRGII